MSSYKYTVHLTYLDPEHGNPIQIYEDNIISLLIDYNYNSEVVMPVVIVKVRLDKNLIDMIVSNKDKGRIILKVAKVNTKEDIRVEEDYINTTCTYELMDDTFNDKTVLYEKNTGGGGEREDIYAQTVIGLISEDCVERNVISTDGTIKGGNMAGVLAYFTKHMPTVIEPFDFNKNIDELIIPPLESIKQVIKHLNTISVFYQTPLRYFNDFHRVYILGSTGNPIPVKGEESSTVVISMKISDTDNDAYELGINYNSQSKVYDLKILSDDTKYMKNNLIDKDFNKIVGIVNPSRKMRLPSISNALSSAVTQAVNNINNAIQQGISKIKEGINKTINGNNMYSYDRGIVKNTSEEYIETTAEAKVEGEQDLGIYYQSCLQMIEKIPIKQAATGSGQPQTEGLSKEEIEEMKQQAEKIYNNGMNGLALLDEVPSDSAQYQSECHTAHAYFNRSAKVGTEAGFNITNIESRYKGVKLDNLAPNLQDMKSQCPVNEANNEYVDNNCNRSDNWLKTSNTTMTDSTNKSINSIDNCKTNCLGLYDLMKKAQEAATVSSNTTGGGGAPVVPPLPITEDEHSTMIGNITNQLDTVKSQQATMSKMYTDMQSHVDNGKNFGSCLKTTQTSITPDITSLSEQAGDLMSGGLGGFVGGILSGGGLGSIVNSFTSNFTQLVQQQMQSGLSSLGISSLDQLSDISSISDLSAVGKVGATSLQTNQLNILNSGGSEKIKYIELDNDDPNKIKVMENSINLKGTTFTINKDNLDNSVLTLNKEYLVKNVNTRTELNGRYLLVRKQELYVREDSLFNSKTILDFARI